MRSAFVLLSILIPGPWAPPAWASRPDTLRCEFLFYSQDRAYVRCDSAAGRWDSIECEGFGPVIRATPPVWEFAAGEDNRLRRGDTVIVLRFKLPRRAVDVSIYGGYDAWDPVEMRTAAAWAVWPLFHRALFRTTPDGQVSGDLARSWLWRGSDLFIVIDTSARFGDGDQVDAHAVKISLERFLWYSRDLPDYAWQNVVAGAENYRRGRIGHVVGLIPRGRDTLQINLVRPNFGLPERLASPATAIVKWIRKADAAPVVATCGHYATVEAGQAADIFVGRADHRGSLLVSHQVADRVWVGGQDQPPCAHERLPAPRLLVLHPMRNLPNGMHSFLHWAIDRRACAAEADLDRDYYGGALPVWWAGERPRHPVEFDYDKAQAARRLLSGRPALAIGFARGLEDETQYLVTALKAWDVRASYASSPEAADVRVELWDFESFSLDAQIERAFALAGLPASDSLVDLLWSARFTKDDLARSARYRSLRSRLDDRNLYVVLLQHDALVTHCGERPLDSRRDHWGRQAGPLFTLEQEP